MRLILTGSTRTGKTTMLLSALAPYRHALGGFYVTRHIRHGRIVAYAMCEAVNGDFQTDVSDSGEVPHAFLTWRENRRVMDLTVFDGFGTDVLRRALHKKLALLDEIGGIELLSDAFYDGLCALLQSETPCIGVFKSEAALERMRRDVADADACLTRRQRIWNLLTGDDRTRLVQASDREANRKVNTFVERIFSGGMER